MNFSPRDPIDVISFGWGKSEISNLFCICQFFSKIDNFKSYWTAISISEDKSSKVKENTKQQILDYTGGDPVNISLAGDW